MEHVELLIVGGGAAGMAAATAAAECGCPSVLLADRRDALGGVLTQCTHSGFGLGIFREPLTGTQYAARCIAALSASVRVSLSTEVLELTADRTALLSSPAGLRRIAFDRCILAAGCRERSLYSLPVGGTRPSGVYSAGLAQAWMNLDGLLVGRRIVILGSGDVGQIMARQLTEAGCEIVCMVEKNAALGGLVRNRRECIEAYGIPVLLRSSVTRLHGSERLCGVTVRALDTGAERYIECDTLLTALGLIPDRTLLGAFGGESPAWLRLCGNCESVHDVVDSVTLDGRRIGREILA